MSRAGAVLAALALLLVCLAVAATSVRLLLSGDLRSIGLGIGVLLLVGLGLVLVAGELRLGAASSRLGRRLAREGGLPEELPERLPSGRLPPEAAERQFEQRRAQTHAAPEDWRAWFRLALAYADARDSGRGRRAMRRAVALEKADRAAAHEQRT